MLRKPIRMEQETSILGNASSQQRHIVTCDPKFIRAIERKGLMAQGASVSKDSDAPQRENSGNRHFPNLDTAA